MNAQLEAHEHEGNDAGDAQAVQIDWQEGLDLAQLIFGGVIERVNEEDEPAEEEADLEDGGYDGGRRQRHLSQGIVTIGTRGTHFTKMQ